MTTRAKLKCVEIAQREHGSQRIRFEALYDQSIPEDQRFYKMTPNGHFEMMISPECAARFEIGKAYYFDVSPCDAGPRHPAFSG